MTDHWSLKGKKALVTGGTKGIGEGIVKEFLALGAEVFLVARTDEDVKKALKDYGAQGLPVQGLVADVSIPEDRRRIIREIRSLWDGLDILINNAGMNLRKPTLEYTVEDFEHLMAANLESAWDLCRLCHPFLKRSPAASIVNLGSVCGHQAVLTSTLPYAMSKAALEQMTRFLAAEWGPEGIRVNAVLPWYTLTPLAMEVLKDQKKREALLAHTPLNRFAECDEVARAVAFLAMSASSYITGVSLPVDGGFLSLGMKP